MGFCIYSFCIIHTHLTVTLYKRFFLKQLAHFRGGYRLIVWIGVSSNTREGKSLNFNISSKVQIEHFKVD